ncbi:MAG: hypothetical protein RIC51_07110 [Erythrobacter sp.]|uniref:hypothetical protein n=1 Tax=Erythrobacter sp. TaxID=1042 RepID=UPI0032EEDC75
MFANEAEFESFIRKVIAEKITAKEPRIYCLDSKKAVDILVCDDREPNRVSFIEVKYHKASHGRLGFGSGAGVGFQPEILQRRPNYFVERLIWVLGSEKHERDKVMVLRCDEILEYVAGGKIEKKFNNIQERVLRDHEWLSRDEFELYLERWLVG